MKVIVKKNKIKGCIYAGQEGMWGGRGWREDIAPRMITLQTR